MPSTKKTTTKKTVTEKKSAVAPRKSKKSTPPQLVRGMKDIVPSEAPYWDMVLDTARSLVKQYGFTRIVTPLVEDVRLFERAVGMDTDIVAKEMFTFEDKSGGMVALRPEATASVARAYHKHGMVNLPQPVKVWYEGPMFRYDRPQAGRQRQFWQFGLEVLGSDDPVLDAQLIIATFRLYEELGIPIVLMLNSIGTRESRKAYATQLTGYYRNKKAVLCEDCKKRLTKNPLRLLDCKVEACEKLRTEAPQIVDWLDEESRNHFMEVLEYLDSSDITYTLNPYLVRGLDYYTKTVFEVVPDNDDKEGAQSALAGGGRYDELVEMLGGRPTPAAGMSLGVERTILQIKQRGISLPPKPGVDIFVAQLGVMAKRKALMLFDVLRREGFSVAESFSKNSLKSQLELASKLHARYTLILGQKEVLDETVLLRDMENSNQEVVDLKKVKDVVAKKLKNGS